MNFEEKFFSRYEINFEKLEKFGFTFKNNAYYFEKMILDDTFKVVIQIDRQSKIHGKIFEIDIDEEYINFRNENQNGQFVNKIRSAYSHVLDEIRKSCCVKKDFIFAQTNRISNKIFEKFGAKPEFLWKDSNAGVFRNQTNSKWFGIIMDIDKSKVDKTQSGLVEVMNIKLDFPQNFCNFKSIFPAYHMNKKYWASIILDDSISDEKIMELVQQSFDNISKK